MADNNNYLDVTLRDAYELIVSRNPWPRTFTNSMKLDLLDKLIEYFEGTQEYERCQRLESIKSDILKRYGGKGKGSI